MCFTIFMGEACERLVYVFLCLFACLCIHTYHVCNIIIMSYVTMQLEPNPNRNWKCTMKLPSQYFRCTAFDCLSVSAGCLL